MELLEIYNRGLLIKRCKNCNKYFIPRKRNDAIYCDSRSPQDVTKTCKEYGAQNAWLEKLKARDSYSGLYRKVYMQKQMRMKRNPENSWAKTDFEEFRVNAREWKDDIKEGSKSEEDFISWLESERAREMT